MQVPIRDRFVIARRGQQKLAAFAFVEPGRAHVSDGELPGVDDLPVQTAIRTCGRHLKHGRPFLQVGESRDVGGGAVGRDGFEMRGGGLGIGDDVVVFETQIVKGGAPKAVDGDCWHVPQDGLEGSLVCDLVLKIIDRADGPCGGETTGCFTLLASAVAQRRFQ
ncbi:hypothetical protein D3C85_1016600 [compost metagenome]